MRMLKSSHHTARTVAIACGAAALLLSAPAVTSAEPNASVSQVEGYVDYVVTDICSFPVAVHAYQQGTISTRQTANDTLFSVSVLEQDTFTANGVSLISKQYGYHFDALVDIQGNV